jgi:regulator of sirC expression with transglutaminase-like and TPR domain
LCFGGRFHRLAVSVLFLVTFAGHDQVRCETVAQTVHAILATPDGEADYARTKLALDKLIDPATDTEATLHDIDRMVADIRLMVPPNAPDIEKLREVRRYIYVSGPWNGNHPYSYDLGDPYGHVIRAKLLAHYMATHRGNCVSMPTLFLILADRVGLHVTLSVAPNHEFLKYTDTATGQTYNIEATSLGYPEPDEWYRSRAPMSDKAVANGVYLKTLNRRETIAVMAEVVLEDEMRHKRYSEAIEIADALLEVYPSQALFLIYKGGAFEGLIRERFQRKYPNGDVPAALLPTLVSLRKKADAAFNRAEALGLRTADGKVGAAKVASGRNSQGL